MLLAKNGTRSILSVLTVNAALREEPFLLVMENLIANSITTCKLEAYVPAVRSLLLVDVWMQWALNGILSISFAASV